MKNISQGLILGALFIALSCGSSNIQSGTSSGQDVAFDPTTNSNLEVVGYTLLKNRLIANFGLDESESEAIEMLDDQQAIFDIQDPVYTSIFSVNYTKIMAKACEEMSNDALFPEGATIDNAWKALTGKVADDSAKALETDILAETSSSGNDVKIFALCLAVSMDPMTVFINYVK